jgi:type I restriction enzyme R subunit/putative DNA methylase
MHTLYSTNFKDQVKVMASKHENTNSWERRVALGHRTQKRNDTSWYSRGYVPHFDAPGTVQHITFHLADSLPVEAVDRMQLQLENLSESEQKIEQRKRINDLLDMGHGSCLLRISECARIVEESLFFGDEKRYLLLAWVIMPNHVHVLIEQLPLWPLGKVVQSWKRHTTRQIKLYMKSAAMALEKEAEYNSAIPESVIWQREYWDRYIRNSQHYETAIYYIENNPVKAALCDSPADWPWGSARFREIK